MRRPSASSRARAERAQQGTSRAGGREDAEAAEAAAAATNIDAQTGKILNEAIELLNMENYAGAGAEDRHADSSKS